MSTLNVSGADRTASSLSTAAITAKKRAAFRYSSDGTDEEEFVGKVDDEDYDDDDDDSTYCTDEPPTRAVAASATAGEHFELVDVRHSADTTNNNQDLPPLLAPTNWLAANSSTVPTATPHAILAHSSVAQQLRLPPAHVAPPCHKNVTPSHNVTHNNNNNKAYHRRPKPPFSYVQLIAMAIRNTPSGRPTLQDINDYLKCHFEFFRGDYHGWKNSIRHNLSLNDCFHKILRDPARPWGKDNYWVLNPQSEDYVFDEKGVMRRKRKRVSPRQPHHHHSSPRHHQPIAVKDFKRRETASCEKVGGNNNFAIDALLGSTATNVKKLSSSALLASTSNQLLPNAAAFYSSACVGSNNVHFQSAPFSLAAGQLKTSASVQMPQAHAVLGSAFARPVTSCQELFSRMLDNAAASSSKCDSTAKIQQWPLLPSAVLPVSAPHQSYPSPLAGSHVVMPTMSAASSLTNVNNSQYGPAAAAWLVLQQMQAAAHHALANSHFGGFSAAVNWSAAQQSASALATAQYYAQLFNASVDNGLSPLNDGKRGSSEAKNEQTSIT